MKDLDRTKAYDLRDLNDEQLTELLEWLKVNDKEWEGLKVEDLKVEHFIGFSEEYGQWLWNTYNREIVNALTLFESELKIGDTFEYNGYICEVKSEVERWVYDYYQESYYKTATVNHVHYKEITNQTLIKLLEENAIH